MSCKKGGEGRILWKDKTNGGKAPNGNPNRNKWKKIQQWPIKMLLIALGGGGKIICMMYFMLLLLKLNQVTDKIVMIMYIYKVNELSLL